MADLPPLHHFWGKVGRHKAFNGAYHPLLCHMADVGAVAEAVWDDVLSPAACIAWTKALGLPDEPTTRAWIAMIAALHDVGKACASFQLQVGRRPPLPAQMRSLLAGMPPSQTTRYAPHGVVTSIALSDLLRDYCGISPNVAESIGKVTGAHHGTFPAPRELDGPVSWRNDLVLESDEWQQTRDTLAIHLIELFGVHGLPRPSGLDNATAMALAGFVSVVDWIGSDKRFFLYAGRIASDGQAAPLDLAAYLTTARQQAASALPALYLTGWTPPQQPAAFVDLFPKLAEHPIFPVQAACVELADRLAPPALVLIEAPMGEGKTEAALYLTDRWGMAPGPRGCYLALPTQATSNQMFQRLTDFLAHRYLDKTVNTNLVHGHAALSTDLRELRERATHPDEQVDPGMTLAEGDLCNEHDGDYPGRLVAGEWFTKAKRGLLAPFGAGTVDQALLAVLQTNHQFVRLFALAHKVIVIDEVHAYDAYMSTLLERLLGWLAALGSPVVLLSATLPAARRQALLAAYARGLNNAEPPPGPKDVYPLISWVDRRGADFARCAAAGRSERTLAVRWVDGVTEAGIGTLGAELKAALADGGCAAVICNTVGHAQKLYAALQDHFAAEELGLFHARFRYCERDAIEQETLARFGRSNDDGVGRPQKYVLVATQVIEQSLDLDFELMVSEVAPVDLVLQRAGRLHRHDRRDRPASLAQPQLWLCRPENEADARRGAAPRFDRGSRFIYDAHILLRSWLALRDLTEIVLPHDIPTLVEEVYGDDGPPTTLSADEHAAWETTFAEMRRAQEDAQARARTVCILPVEGASLDALLSDANKRLEEDAPDVHRTLRALTRITQESLTVVVLTENEVRKRGFDERRRPDLAMTEWLLRHAVPVTNARVVFARGERALPAPKAWAEVGMLRDVRLALLDGDRRCRPGDANYRLYLDTKRGLVVERL